MSTLNRDAVAKLERGAGYGISGDIGGVNKKRYFTPDGETLFKVPCMREYARKDKDGKVIETGIRDANYDRGWLDQMPPNPVKHCPHCTEWHFKPEEYKECKAKKKRIDAWGNRMARNLKKQEHADADALRTEISDLKDVVAKQSETVDRVTALLEKQLGATSFPTPSKEADNG